MSVPGVSSHDMMAPEFRKEELVRVLKSKTAPRHAAVMILFFPKNNKAHIALILRPTYEGVHSGQIALPGGKTEESDVDYKDTALRETYEEIGVEPLEIEVIKELTDVFVPPSNFWVHPFIGFTKKQPDFVPQEDEVESIIEVPISELLSDTNFKTKKLSTSYAKNVEVPCFYLNGYVVWGATAMMLNELKMILKVSLG